MVTTPSSEMTLEAFLENPRDRTEWVNGELVKKGDMNAKTGRIQARLARYWGNYQDLSRQGGEVYTETPCHTVDKCC